MPVSDRCSQVRSLLPRLAAGEVTQTQADACRIHLTACPACRAEADAAVRAHRALSAYRPAPPPPGLDRRIAEAARVVRVRRWAPLRWAQAGGLVAAAAAAAACVQFAPGWRITTTEPVLSPVQPPAVQGVRLRPALPQAAVRPPGADPAPGSAAPYEPDSGSAQSAAPVRAAARRTRTHRVVNPMPASFMDVRDASGRSARQIMAALRSSGPSVSTGAGMGSDGAGSSTAWRPGRFAVPGRPVYETRSSEGSLQVGRRRVRTSAEAGWDAQWRLSVIRLAAEAEGDKSAVVPDRTPK